VSNFLLDPVAPSFSFFFDPELRYPIPREPLHEGAKKKKKFIYATTTQIHTNDSSRQIK